MHSFNLQPTHLSNNLVQLVPLQATDFEALFSVAADPAIWEQHPTKNRYERDVFTIYFEGAIASGGAFLIIEKSNKKIIGCTRYYQHQPTNDFIYIGYTFFATAYWGGNYNSTVKKLMIDYAFTHYPEIRLEVGEHNIRSQKAIERLGAEKIAMQAIAYHGEQPNNNFIYSLKKEKHFSLSK